MITKTRSLYLKVLCVPERCFVVHCPAGHSTSKLVNPQTLYFKVSCPTDTLLRSKLSHGHSASKQVVPWTLCFEVSCPTDTLLRSRLSPHKGDNLLQGGSLRSRVSGRTAYFELKCSGGGLLRSNFPPPPPTLYFGGQVTS